MNKDGRVGFEEKSPIHVADVVRMIELSNSRLNEEESELSEERKVRSILKAGIGHEATLASPCGCLKKTVWIHIASAQTAKVTTGQGEWRVSSNS